MPPHRPARVGDVYPAAPGLCSARPSARARGGARRATLRAPGIRRHGTSGKPGRGRGAARDGGGPCGAGPGQRRRPHRRGPSAPRRGGLLRGDLRQRGVPHRHRRRVRRTAIRDRHRGGDRAARGRRHDQSSRRHEQRCRDRRTPVLRGRAGRHKPRRAARRASAPGHARGRRRFASAHRHQLRAVPLHGGPGQPRKWSTARPTSI